MSERLDATWDKLVPEGLETEGHLVLIINNGNMITVQKQYIRMVGSLPR